MRRIFGLDLDGVLYPWHEEMYKYFFTFKEYTGTFIDFWSEYFISLPIDEQEYYVKLPIPYDTTSPKESTVSFLNECEDRGDIIYYITSRDESLDRITRRYLKRHNFPFQDNLIMSKDKITSCRRYDITDFLDDFTKYVNDASSICNGYLMDKLWNKTGRLNYPVVSNIKEFRDLVYGG